MAAFGPIAAGRGGKLTVRFRIADVHQVRLPFLIGCYWTLTLPLQNQPEHQPQRRDNLSMNTSKFEDMTLQEAAFTVSVIGAFQRRSEQSSYEAFRRKKLQPSICRISASADRENQMQKAPRSWMVFPLCCPSLFF
jgi:hypothetical protein